MVCCSVCVWAQTDTTTVATENKWKKYVPTGIRLGTDVISLVRPSYDDTFKGWEVNGDVDFNRFYLALDYGRWARTFARDTGKYENEGNYWRVGIDVNFLTKDPDKNMFFLGARYGHSVFSEKWNTIIVDPVWGTMPQTFETNRMRASWFELTTGLRVKMWKMIWMGYTARFKFGLSMDKSQDMIPSDVPGYGRTDKDSYWGFNYQIFIRIPLKTQPKPVATAKP